jgi:hypothetical protein
MEVCIIGFFEVPAGEDMEGYAAGLWRNYQAFQMIWRCRDPVVRPNQYRAPTWSWATIDAAIIPLRAHFSHQKLVELRQVLINCLTRDPYGEVVHAKGEFKRCGYLKVWDETSDLFRSQDNKLVKQTATSEGCSNKPYELF